MNSTCFAPKGISNTTDISFDQINSLLNGTALGNPLPYLFLPLAEPLINALVQTYETPIQFRQVLYHGNVNYNVAAMFHPTALDIWGKKDKKICLDQFTSESDKNIYEQVAIAYSFAYISLTTAPASKNAIMDIMDNVLKLPMNYILNDEDPDVGTPWGLAKACVDQITKYAESDGWNADGSMMHEGEYTS